jgi:superfamily II DNA or RNA helicase
MNYELITQCFDDCIEHLNDGGGKITSIVLKPYNISDKVKSLIREDYITVKIIIDYYYEEFKNIIIVSSDLVDALNKIEFIKTTINKKKIKLIQYNEVIINWLRSTEFFIDIYEKNPPPDKIREDEIDCNTINSFIPRENQSAAFNRLDKNGIETGIHSQSTGCGKSFIIIRYCDHSNKQIKNPKIILFTERVNILKDLFSFKNGNLECDMNKLKKWKEMGIGDLTNFNIINRVTYKDKNWHKELIESNKPTLLVINRAYLTQNKLYKIFTKDNIHMVLHDECHNTSSIQCHDFLLKCKSLQVPVIGFSATPLRTGKYDKPKLLEIYGKPDKKEELHLLTDFNMIYAINKKLILAPEFYWYEIQSYNKEKSEDKNNEIVTQQELGSVLELLNYIIEYMPNKKIIAWCGTIALAKRWKQLIEANFKQRKNLINLKFGLDTSENDTGDYDLFRTQPIDKDGNIIERDKLNDKSSMYYGNSILFCANKHREGSDIRLLDGCIFLDKVKDRSPIPFIQSIGRVLRICPDTPDKICGIVMDGFVKNGDYEKEFVTKIFDYYMALENLSGLNENDKSKYEQYIELREVVRFDKETQTIKMKLGKQMIKIHCNKLEWSNIVEKFDTILQEKIKLSVEDKLLFEFNKLKNKISKFNFIDKNQYFDYASEHNLELEPNIKYVEYWTNWYDFLGTDISIYPKNKLEWKLVCDNYNIHKESKYQRKWNKYNLPSMPEELYKEFGMINNELKETNTSVSQRKIDL